MIIALAHTTHAWQSRWTALHRQPRSARIKRSIIGSNGELARGCVFTASDANGAEAGPHDDCSFVQPGTMRTPRNSPYAETILQTLL